MKLLSTKATCNSHGQDSSYFLGWQEYEKNPYHEFLNPKGIIQMGLAENQVNYTFNFIPTTLIFSVLSYKTIGKKKKTKFNIIHVTI